VVLESIACDISGYMCGARRVVVRGLLLTTTQYRRDDFLRSSINTGETKPRPTHKKRYTLTLRAVCCLQELLNDRAAAGASVAQTGTESSLRGEAEVCDAGLPLNVRKGFLRTPPGHNTSTRNTRCAGMCQMQRPQNTHTEQTHSPHRRCSIPRTH